MSPSPTSPGTPPELTEIPQRRLALELRFWIDYTMRRPTFANKTVLRLMIEDNPTGWASSHVQHNLGERRLAWIEENLKEVYP